MRRLTATALACALAAIGVLRSHLWPLLLLALLGAALGLVIALSHRDEPSARVGDLLRLPAYAAGVVLVLVGIGQLGLVGLLVGGVLLALVPAFAREREHRS